MQELSKLGTRVPLDNHVLQKLLPRAGYKYVGFQPKASRCANSFKTMKQELTKVYE